MSNQAAQFALAFERLGHEVLAQLHGLPDSMLYWPPPLPKSASLFALATQLVEEGEVWLLTVVGGQRFAPENVSEEHVISGWRALAARYERWLAATHTVLDYLPDDMLDQFVAVPSSIKAPFDDGSVTVCDCLLYALGRVSWLAGHLQFLRQLLADGERLLREVVPSQELSILAIEEETCFLK